MISGPDPAFYTPKPKDEGTRGLGLFDAAMRSDALVPSVAVDTSEEAAIRSHASGARRSQADVLLSLLIIHPYLTADDIDARTEWGANTVNARLYDFKQQEWVEYALDDDGQQIYRQTRKGSRARAVRLTARGRAAAEGR